MLQFYCRCVFTTVYFYWHLIIYLWRVCYSCTAEGETSCSFVLWAMGTYCTGIPRHNSTSLSSLIFFSCKVSGSFLLFSPSPGGCEGEPQEEGDGGEDQAGQAGKGESWAGKAGTAAEEKATDWHEQRYSACAQLELAAASNNISHNAEHRMGHRSTL